MSSEQQKQPCALPPQLQQHQVKQPCQPPPQEPCVPQTKEPCHTKVPEPCQPKVPEPCQPKVPEPCQPKVPEPCQPKVPEPCQSKVPEPCQPKVPEPCQPKVPEPCQPKVPEPCPSAVTPAPAQQKTKQNGFQRLFDQVWVIGKSSAEDERPIGVFRGAAEVTGDASVPSDFNIATQVTLYLARGGRSLTQLFLFPGPLSLQ
ncbi:Hypothetical predicted protein [Marmota monax]|uniref:Cornifin n=1 Tax=Marmota monax TaxID=9995 RepID=A0A5E4A7S4_MARMO|nr:cornifin [Marmota monax]VTJ53174.1 Hypothetical predicted protein [Marmota monax]